MIERSLVVMEDTVRGAAEVARLADAAGFHAVWTTEFYDRDAFVRMTAMGLATSRITIASGIAYGFVRNPVLTAAGVADMDDATDGRIVLGLGTGTRRMNESWYGIPFAHPAPKMRETVQLLRALWAAKAGPKFKFDGRFYHIALDNYSLAQLQRDDIPVYIAGVNTGMIAVAGEVADGLVGHPLYSRRYLAEIVRPALDRGTAKAGRTAHSAKIASYVIAAVHADAAQARREAKAQIAFYSTVRTYDPILDLHGWEAPKQRIREAFAARDWPAMVDAVTEEMVDEIAIAGTPADCRRQLDRWEGLIDEALLYSPTFAVAPARVAENHRMLIDCFAAEAVGKEVL
ncbi:MAG: LLM class flavin-dependent oxidoreductase [Dehalococcoidia bacterium]